MAAVEAEWYCNMQGWPELDLAVRKVLISGGTGGASLIFLTLKLASRDECPRKLQHGTRGGGG